jgi:hypothetical protein
MNGKGGVTTATNGNGSSNGNGHISSSNNMNGSSNAIPSGQPVSRYARRSLFSRVTTALTSTDSNGSTSTTTNKSNNDKDSNDKYRKGRSRKRLQLALQQRSFAARILGFIALGSVGFALFWHLAVPETSTTGTTGPFPKYHYPHRNPLLTHWSPAVVPAPRTEKALQKLTEPLWVDQGGPTVPASAVDPGNPDAAAAAVAVAAAAADTTTTTVTLPDRSDFKTIIPQIPGNAVTRRNFLARLFEQQRRKGFSKAHIMKLLQAWLHQADQQLIQNLHGGNQWIPSFLLPTLTGDIRDAETVIDQAAEPMPNWLYFHTYRMNETHMAWEREWRDMKAQYNITKAAKAAARHHPESEKQQQPLPPLEQPIVDYTDPAKYKYPPVQLDLPAHGTYPEFRKLGDMMKSWPQDEDNAGIITESLIHFNYSDPVEREAARKFRDAELPFKLYDVPEITNAGALWTDEYLTKEFDQSGLYVAGSVQESLSNYILFFTRWDIFTLGLPPIRYNDWNYAKWNEHAKYADASRLPFDLPHYYFQAAHFLGKEYETRTKWSFLARDLPSFSYPAEGGYNETFFVFHPDPQRGLQCRFSERGVLSSSHYDGTRNFITMVKGAKRYILAPPRECSKLGVIPSIKSPMYRHSILNYRHFDYLHDMSGAAADMSDKERAWLQKAAGSQAVETVLKAGEVMYLPCNWFHYIASLQRSAQCNVRSNLDEIGNPEFGGRKEVRECKD